MKYDLDETWELCIKQRTWIVEQREAGSELGDALLKRKWMEDNGFEDEDIFARCFFCQYVLDTIGVCRGCPACLVDPDFHCSNDEYHHERKPRAFLQRLLELDKLRKSTGD